MTITITTPTTIAADGLLFTEDPRWHAGRLYFSDTIAGRVCALDAQGRLSTVATLDDHCSGLGFLPGGDLLIVSAGARRLLRAGAGGLTQHADLAALAPQGINDMAVDGVGRAYVGEMAYDPERPLQPVPGRLFLVRPDGAVSIAADELLMPNGTVITDDGRLIIAETLGCRISVFDIAADGSLGNRRLFAQLPDGYFPDGIGMDSAGGIWAACPGGPGVVRVEQGGAITHCLPMTGGHNAYACVVGGDDGRTLYICTAETHEHERLRALRSSRIERLSLD